MCLEAAKSCEQAERKKKEEGIQANRGNRAICCNVCPLFMFAENAHVYVCPMCGLDGADVFGLTFGALDQQFVHSV